MTYKSNGTHVHNRSNSKKKKINKQLCEIVGPEKKKLLELNTGSATRFFDDESEKRKVQEVLANSFKTNTNKDYFNRLFGYTHREFVNSVHNPLRKANMCRAANKDPCVPENHLLGGLIPIYHSHDGESKLWQIIYIKHDNKLYMMFNVIITMNCLISSYYYASLVGFRYSAGGEIDVDYKGPTLAFEILFLLHMITQFMVEYKVEGEKMPVTDPFKIWTNYLNTSFPLDIVCLLPL